MRVMVMLVCLAGCLDEYGDHEGSGPVEAPVDEPPPPPPATERVCQFNGDSFCNGSFRVRCEWYDPSPVESLLGAQPGVVARRYNCLDDGQTCSSIDEAHCADEADKPTLTLSCDQHVFTDDELHFSRLGAVAAHPCSTVSLAREEIVVELHAAPGAEAPTIYALDAVAADSFQLLVYDRAPWESNASCTTAADVGVDVSVDPGTVRYLVIDGATAIDRDKVLELTSTCTVCGNGRASEQCDDGNVVDGDGCSSQCTIESGWYCDIDVNGLSTCTQLP